MESLNGWGEAPLKVTPRRPAKAELARGSHVSFPSFHSERNMEKRNGPAGCAGPCSCGASSSIYMAKRISGGPW